MSNSASGVIRSLFFTSGCIPTESCLVAPAQYNAFPNESMSRVALRFNEEWAYHDVDTDVIGSCLFRVSDHSLWLIGRHGTVRTVSSGAKDFTLDRIRGRFATEYIPSKGFGEILGVALVENQLIACGQSLQVYKRAKNGWVRFDSEMREMAAPALEAVAGSTLNDLYAVGEKGLILHHNGNRWQRLDSPTNRPLSIIRH